MEEKNTISLSEWQAFLENRCWQAIRDFFASTNQTSTGIKILQSVDEALVQNANVGRMIGISTVLSFPEKMITDLLKQREKEKEKS